VANRDELLKRAGDFLVGSRQEAKVTIGKTFRWPMPSQRIASWKRDDPWASCS
jgi:hypothetical protein